MKIYMTESDCESEVRFKHRGTVRAEHDHSISTSSKNDPRCETITAETVLTLCLTHQQSQRA